MIQPSISTSFLRWLLVITCDHCDLCVKMWTINCFHLQYMSLYIFLSAVQPYLCQIRKCLVLSQVHNAISKISCDRILLCDQIRRTCNLSLKCLVKTPKPSFLWPRNFYVVRRSQYKLRKSTWLSKFATFAARWSWSLVITNSKKITSSHAHFLTTSDFLVTSFSVLEINIECYVLFDGFRAM